MNYARVALFCEKATTAQGYTTLFSDLTDTFKVQLFHSDEVLSFDFFHLIVIDFSSKKERNTVQKILQYYHNKAKIAIVSPYTLNEITALFEFADGIDLLLVKPFLIERLTTFVQHHCRLINHTIMLETKTGVLSEVVELNPNRIAIYNESSLLFYANNNYLTFNAIDLSHIDTLFFNQISHCQVGFENILYNLAQNRSYTLQRQEEDRWVESVFYRLPSTHIVHICKDITNDKQNEIRLEQAGIFFDQSSEALLITNKDGIILSVNSSFCRITGYSKEEAIGRTTKLLHSGMHDKSFYEAMWSSLIHNNSWQGEIWNRRKNGEIYPEWLSINKANNPKYNEEFYIAVFTDISTLKETDRKLYFYANHDPLTGLANRTQFETQLKKQLETAKRRNNKIAILFIDLDKFKEVNDTYGHTIGDLMLKSITKKLSDTIRAEDFLFRIGGDEFVIIAGGAENYDGILNLANKLSEAVKEAIEIEGKVFFMTLSIGISIFPDHGENAENLIKNADSAMYEVKENGRNGYMLYQNIFSEKLNHRVEIQNDLKNALKEDQFELYYQPIISLKDRKLIGAEALVRWNHPKKGLLYPASFINYVEESSMIHEFGMMVCSKAFESLGSFNSVCSGIDLFHLSINIATKQFFDELFVEKIQSLMKDFDINPQQIELEILETQVMQNPQIAQKKFEELHALGITLSLDDFGTGYSSLSYLKNFTLNKLKIDQTFVRDMLKDNNDKAIIEAIITMGKIFNMKVQAEGVETLEHETALVAMGCDLSQGYCYSHPLPLIDFIEWGKNYRAKHL